MNPVSLITGASSGIGEQIARKMAARNYNLVLCARRQDRLMNLKKEIVSQFPKVQVLVEVCDVRKNGDVERAVSAALQKWNRLDVVFANAGFSMVNKVEDSNLQDFEELFATNTFGVLRTLYATLPHLKKSRGQLAIVGSVMSYVSTPGTAAYCMTKASLKPLAETLQYELKSSGVGVTFVCPGFIATDIRTTDRYGRIVKDMKDPAPAFLNVPADRAARQIVRDVLRRKKMSVISWHAKFAIWIERFFPQMLRLGVGMFESKLDHYIIRREVS